MTNRTRYCLLMTCLSLPWFGPSPSLAGTPLTTERIVTGLTAPIFVTHAPEDFERIFIVEQCGRIKIYKNGAMLPTPFIDLDPLTNCSGEQGLLGLAFHPNYACNGQFFVNYTNLSGNTIVERYTVSNNPDVADGASAEHVLFISQPFANHNGGWMDFGPDGYLYIATGDGGSGNDPGNRAQTITNQLLGKILRIDVDGPDAFPADPLKNYAIPPTNPFVGVTGDDEIWAYGLRNPWRNSFDRLTNDLYIGDVGQDAWEEINFQPAGATTARNYGWRCMEGAHCTGLSGCTCNAPALTLPIHEYAHVTGLNSVTGGYVYRGCTIPDLVGTYFFSDYGRNQIWSLRYDGVSVSEFQERTAELVPPVGSIATPASFGEDAYGELYICDVAGGEIFKIVPDAAITDTDNNGIADACDIFREQSIGMICVPAVSTWALIILILLILTAGSLVLDGQSGACA